MKIEKIRHGSRLTTKTITTEAELRRIGYPREHNQYRVVASIETDKSNVAISEYIDISFTKEELERLLSAFD